MRVIKRYTNRKLYDTEDSHYVTLDEIAGMVKNGEDVQIVDNRSGDDLTEVTLAQILFEEQKKDASRMPLGMLTDLIRSSGESITHFIEKRVTSPVKTLKEEAERRVDDVLRRGETSVEDRVRQVRDFFSSTHQTIEDMQKRLDDSIGGVLASTPGVRKQLSALKQKIEEFETWIGRAESGSDGESDMDPDSEDEK